MPFSSISGFHPLHRQPHDELRPQPHDALRMNRAAVRGDDLFHDRQAQSQAARLGFDARLIDLIETLEDARRALRAECRRRYPPR